MAKRPEQEVVRFQKLEELRKDGFSFPNNVSVNASSAQLLQRSVAEEPGGDERFTIAGRIVLHRLMGKAGFAHVLDGEGKLQIYVKREAVGEPAFDGFKAFDIGDIVEASGYLFLTKTGEKTLHVESIRLLVKSLAPLPEKWHGLTDVEARYRQRYLDLISNPEGREIFRKRAKVIQTIRRFLDDRGFLEVETPTLHYIPGGAEARPFATHHNALHADMFLRIALELPLKKLVVGGLERVYEIGRVFRNEGLSKKHNPEFTMLEFYQAYATFEDLMRLTEELMVTLVKETSPNLLLRYGEHEINFAPPYRRISMEESIFEIGGVAREGSLTDLQFVHQVATHHRVELKEKENWGKCIENLWEELVEAKLINPTFITHHPFSISPLARKNDERPEITDRFELFIAGMETANAFSELNDAIDQRQRFEAQAARKASGDEEACDIEEDFLRALEYGFPPSAGEGIGIDRLVMLLTNQSTIRDVLLFPQLKPKVQETEESAEEIQQ